MSKETSDLFRKEALEHYRQGKTGEGGPLRIAPSWTRWTYWLLLAVAFFAIGYGLLARIDEYAEGPAIVTRAETDEAACRVLAFLPAESAERITPASPARVRVTGLRGEPVAVVLREVSSRWTGPDEALRQLGEAAAGETLPRGPVLAVRGVLSDCEFDTGRGWAVLPEGSPGVLEVVVRSERILLSLVPGLKKLLGGEAGD